MMVSDLDRACDLKIKYDPANVFVGGVALGSVAQGKVVVDKKAAERILRARLAAEPLSFGEVYSVRVWPGRGKPLRSMIVALNAEGLHLYSWDREPQRLETFCFAWGAGAEPTLVGWQAIEHDFASEEDRALALEMSSSDEDEQLGASLVVHVLVDGALVEGCALRGWVSVEGVFSNDLVVNR